MAIMKNIVATIFQNAYRYSLKSDICNADINAQQPPMVCAHTGDGPAVLPGMPSRIFKTTYTKSGCALAPPLHNSQRNHHLFNCKSVYCSRLCSKNQADKKNFAGPAARRVIERARNNRPIHLMRMVRPHRGGSALGGLRSPDKSWLLLSVRPLPPALSG